MPLTLVIRIVIACYERCSIIDIIAIIVVIVVAQLIRIAGKVTAIIDVMIWSD